MCGVETESVVEVAEKAVVSNEVEADVRPSVIDDNVDRCATMRARDA